MFRMIWNNQLQNVISLIKIHNYLTVKNGSDGIVRNEYGEDLLYNQYLTM